MDESNEPDQVVIRVSRAKLTNLIAARDAYRKAQRENHELSAAFEKAGEDLDHATMDLVATVATSMLLDGLDPSEVPEAELQQIRDAYDAALKVPSHDTIQELFRLGINAQIQANALSKRINKQEQLP
jgi:predicted NBD/HSP70 family sugar kinase